MSGFRDKYKVHSLFVVSEPLNRNSTECLRFTNFYEKASKKSMSWRSEI